MKRLWPQLKNLYVIASVSFLVWMMFFDRNDFFSQYAYHKKLNKVKEDKAYYIREIKKNKADMTDLMSDREHLEKFAREKYLMKKNNEDVFLLIPDKPDQETAFTE